MSKKQIIAISILTILLVVTVAGGCLIHLYVFPRTTVYKEVAIPANEIVKIEVQKSGYSDKNFVTDEAAKDLTRGKLNDLRITKAYRYEHKDADVPPSYIYTLYTSDPDRFFSVRFYDDGKKIDIIQYDPESKKSVGFEYTVEAFPKNDLEFFQALIKTENWKTPGPEAPLLDQLSPSTASFSSKSNSSARTSASAFK